MPGPSEHPLADRLRALAGAFRRTRPPARPPTPDEDTTDAPATEPALPPPLEAAAVEPEAAPAGPVVLPMPNAPLSWYVAGMSEGEALGLAEALTQLGLAGQRFLRCPHDRTRIYYLRPEDVRGIACPLCGADDFLVFEMES
jgi:hypothetical protein